MEDREEKRIMPPPFHLGAPLRPTFSVCFCDKHFHLHTNPKAWHALGRSQHLIHSVKILFALISASAERQKDEDEHLKKAMDNVLTVALTLHYSTADEGSVCTCVYGCRQSFCVYSLSHVKYKPGGAESC